MSITAATSSSITEPWSVGEIPAQFARITELADRCGYLACLFGSTMKQGRGRDLDVAMVSRFREQQNWPLFLQLFGGELVKKTERADRGSFGFEVAKDGRLYDFRFGRF